MPRSCRPLHGFTLIETLAALALLTLTLFLGLALVLQHPRIAARLDAQREAVHALEGTLEALRAGVLPLASQGFPPAGPHGLTLSIHVAPEGFPPGLHRVTVRAVYLVQGRLRERTVETLVWRPPP